MTINRDVLSYTTQVSVNRRFLCDRNKNNGALYLEVGVSTKEDHSQQQQKCNMYVRLCPAVACTVLVWYMFRDGVRFV